MALTTSIKTIFVLTLVVSVNKSWAADIEKQNLKWTNEASANFLNYEWKDPKVEGETYFNSTLKSLASYADDSFKVKVGATGLRSFGDQEKAGKAEPWLQITIDFASNVHLSMGTLEDDHKAHEALIAEHRRFDDITEEGFQLRYLGDLIESELWLNWHRRETQKEAEQFEVGSVNKFTTPYLDIDLQFIAHHIDGQKTEDTTSLRNNVAILGGTMKLPTPIQPLLGARVLSSSYKLNDGADAKGVTREAFLGTNITLNKERNLTARIVTVKGHDFNSLYGLKPYNLEAYDYFEISYHQGFKSASDPTRFATFGFRARAEKFSNETHSTQEMTLALHF